MRLAIAMMVCFIIVVVVTIYALHTNNVRQSLLGTLGVILSIVMYACPLSVVVSYESFCLSKLDFLEKFHKHRENL